VGTRKREPVTGGVEREVAVRPESNLTKFDQLERFLRTTTHTIFMHAIALAWFC